METDAGVGAFCCVGVPKGCCCGVEAAAGTGACCSTLLMLGSKDAIWLCSEDTMIEGANVSRSAQKKEWFYGSEAWGGSVSLGCSVKREEKGAEL